MEENEAETGGGFDSAVRCPAGRRTSLEFPAIYHRLQHYGDREELGRETALHGKPIRFPANIHLSILHAERGLSIPSARQKTSRREVGGHRFTATAQESDRTTGAPEPGPTILCGSDS